MLRFDLLVPDMQWVGVRECCKRLLKAAEEEGNVFLLAEQGIAKEVREVMLKVVRKTQGKRGNIIREEEGSEARKSRKKEKPCRERKGEEVSLKKGRKS